MSNDLFVLVLAAGAALLAVWTHVRFPSLAPDRLGRTVMHAVSAFVLLKAATAVEVGATSILAMVFVLVLPALVYALLCMIWMIQHAQTALGLSR